ncbi:AcrR family transcriptional regulator [Cellulosimicrobium cellulans]|uniref:TetR/AcrR family transcriptional regulator n=1 Tax=Cellulosimicrobium cellulans TaxID=1710 RepID=UPI00195CA2F5|nr:TetR/AcrR family transcriptional regulator [Cellulosimicrobium cellulans]MBM7817639.1 AcrR family transcriptional regulator [Cellulosimicrobium cellulans]
MTGTDADDRPSTDRPDAGTELPPVIARLWGRGTAPRRGPKPALTVEQVVRAAVDLADAEGLPAVSMARVAESLGYSSMALYRYVESKDELLVLMADAAADVLELPPYDEGDWRAGLEAWTRAQIAGVLARPWFLDLPLTTAQVGPNRLRWIDRGFAILAPLDLTVDEKLQIVGLLAQHVLGEGRVQVETRRAAAEAVRRAQGLPADTPEADLDADAVAAANPYADYELVLTRLVDPETYPALTGALASWTPTAVQPDDWESDIGFGLDILLDGIEAFVTQRATARGTADHG